MKRLAALALVLLVSAAGLYLAQRGKHPDAVSPDLLLNAAAGVQHDLTRVPMRLTRLSDAEEIRIGDALAQRYVGERLPLTPPGWAAQLYVAQIGARVAAHARRRLPYRFHLIPNPGFVNAFAIPGGHVFIGQGLINQMSTEDELAFVLGHEIEHIDHYHAVERVQIESQLRSLNLDVVAALAQIPASLWEAGFSKDEEFEADREGLRIAVASGYSPEGALGMLNRLLALQRENVIHAETPVGELSQVASEGLDGYFRSHPDTSERLARIVAVIADDHLTATNPLRPLNRSAKNVNLR
ncbi:MAG: M48 family metallopeptidase [Terriglobales bacterium]